MKPTTHFPASVLTLPNTAQYPTPVFLKRKTVKDSNDPLQVTKLTSTTAISCPRFVDAHKSKLSSSCHTSIGAVDIHGDGRLWGAQMEAAVHVFNFWD